MPLPVPPSKASSQRDLQTLMEQLSVGIAIVDITGQVINVNVAAVKMLGAPNREALLSVNVLTEPRLIESGVSSMFKSVLDSGTPFEVETAYETRWGKKVQLRTKVSPRHDDQGRLAGAIQLLEDISERKQTQDQLVQQLQYERGLAQAARILLQSPEDESTQRAILDNVLESLRVAAQVDRAFVIHVFTDANGDEHMRLVAEACAPDVFPLITNPQNQYLPVKTILPDIVYRSLAQGKAIGGAVTELWRDMPKFRDELLSHPLLSVQMFPIFSEGRWWGFVGFDEIKHVRQWRDQEIMLLQTAADIIGNALQRWEARRALQEERDALEMRVLERTALLEKRLQMERVLATAAARLITNADFGTAVRESLKDIGEAVDAIQVLLVRIDMENQRILESYRWHPPEVETWTLAASDVANWFRKQLVTRKPLYIADTTTFFAEDDVIREALLQQHIAAMIMHPLEVEGEIAGIFNISLKTPLTGPGARDIIKMLDIKANLLNGLIQRQILIEQRDRQILEQTRALSTMLDAAMLDSEARSLEDVVRPILTHIAELSQAQTLAVYELNPDGRYEKIAEHGALDVEFSWRSTFRPNDVLTGWLRDRDEPLLLPAEDLIVMTHLGSATERSGVGMAVNIRAWRRFNGLLLCYRPGDEQYSPNQVALTTALADYMSTIIENYLLRELAENTAIIEERSRLARDLHDSVSQSLYGVMLFARAGRDALESGETEALAVDLKRVEENALRAMKEMRLLLFQLQPLALDQTGLEAALAQRFEQVEGRLGIDAELSIDPDIALTPHQGESLYRLASEALNNALKHAEASRVSVRLVREGDEFILTITDNGRGFDARQMAGPGMGLANMHYRAERLGGRLDIHSAPGEGTVIRCRIPANPEI